MVSRPALHKDGGQALDVFPTALKPDSANLRKEGILHKSFRLLTSTVFEERGVLL